METLIGLILFILTVYGLYLAFRESIVLGIISFLLWPAGVIYTLAYLILKEDLPKRIMDWWRNRGQA
jgi:hypothetical protein